MDTVSERIPGLSLTVTDGALWRWRDIAGRATKHMRKIARLRGIVF
jgi:hypothetical protein